LAQFVDDHRADAKTARPAVDRQRTDLRHLWAERRELGASDDGAAAHRDDESFGMKQHLVERARQQVPFFEVGRDERMQPASIRSSGAAQQNPPGRHARSPPCWALSAAAAATAPSA
jgi:hypothetical protein